MKNFYYDLSGGINLCESKISLGMDTKKMCWSDSENIEIYQNRGIVRMRGNARLASLLENLSHEYDFGDRVQIVAIQEYGGLAQGGKADGSFVFVAYGRKIDEDGIVGYGGDFYYYDALSGEISLKKGGLSAFEACTMVPFLGGIVFTNGVDAPFYFELGRTENVDGESVSAEIVEFGAEGADGQAVRGSAAAVFAGRLWIAGKSVVWYSALGSFEDWTSAQDAGYIRDFHSSTSEITCLKPYMGNLAIYKTESIYLLTGSGHEDFAVARFSDRGASGANSVLTLNNKQYLFNEYGVFTLSQVGELAQLMLSDNVAAKIAPVFENFDKARLKNVAVVPYEAKNQIWFVFGGYDDEKCGVGVEDTVFQSVIWVYDYVCRAWFKRVIPRAITACGAVCGRIYTADAFGRVYIEDMTSEFDGEAVRFRFSSPFLTLGEPNSRKTVEEFYFIFDEERDNRFNFAVSKDYLTGEKDDLERISDYQPRALIWDSEFGDMANATYWGGLGDFWINADGEIVRGDGLSGVSLATEGIMAVNWAEAVESAYKTEINGSNLSVQLHFEGRELEDDLAIIGLEFKEVYYD